MIGLNVGDRLKELRELKGISVNKLSNLAGLSQSFVREIELSQKNPTVDSLEYLCDALGITLNDFFDVSITNTIRNDRALRLIYRLRPDQRESMTNFLETIVD